AGPPGRAPPRPRAGEGARDGPAAAAARRARAEDHDTLLAHRDVRHARPGDQRGDRDGGGALDVVVEGGEDVAVALEERERRALFEVLPLEQRLREAAPDGLHELLDQLVVRCPAQPGLTA